MTPVIVIHSLAHARAALSVAVEAGVAVTLASAPGAAVYIGAPVFREMIAQAAQAVPSARFTAVLDCGDDAGAALNALRHGLRTIRLDAPAETLRRVADIAGQSGATVLEALDGPCLDLAESSNPEASCRAFLVSAPTS